MCIRDSTWPAGFQGKRAVGNPDAFAIKVHLTGRGAASSLLRASSGKQRSVQDRELRFPGSIRDGNGKYTGVFVVHVTRIDAMIRSKGRQP